MNPEKHERRQRIWELIVRDDRVLTDIIATITEEFNVSTETVEDDIDTIDEWLPELDLLREVQGISLLAELRQNRQRLHQMADEAHNQGESTQERQIRAEINRSLNLERQLSNSSIQITKQKDAMEEFL